MKILNTTNIIKIIFVLAVFAVIPAGAAKEEKATSCIALNTTSAYPLVINDKKVEIVSGISNEDMDRFNQNPTPEAIKLFMQSIADEYNVDWKLVYAIGYHESGNYGSSLARNNNNYFGRKASGGGYASWESPEKAIRNQFTYLKTRYFDRGMNTPATINPVYAEDSSWQFAVLSVMNTL